MKSVMVVFKGALHEDFVNLSRYDDGKLALGDCVIARICNLKFSQQRVCSWASIIGMFCLQ